MHHASQTRVRPDDRRVAVASEERAQLAGVLGLYPRLAERAIHVVMENDHQPGLCGEIEDSVERGIDQARWPTGDLRRHELLVNRELADAHEHAWERSEHATDVIGGVHVRGIEAR